MKAQDRVRLPILVGAIWFFATAAAIAAGAPGSPSLRKISIAYSGISPGQSPIWVAQEAGFFRKYGYDVQMVFIESGSRTVQTLISGDVTAAQVAGAPVVQSNLQGSNIVLIAGLLNTLDYKLMVARDITRPEQLKGKTLAVARPGGSADFATRYALEKYGLVPDKDVTLLELGSQPARYAALEAGKVQGVMIAIPLTAKATKAGFNTLADLQMLGLEYQHTGLAFHTNVLKSQPDLARNILKAFVEAVHYMKTEKRETLAILGKYFKTAGPDELEEVYEAAVLTLFPQKPYPTLKGIQTILRELGIKDPAARVARPEQFVDLTFIKELDASGFIDNLYKTTSVAKRAPETAPMPVAKRETPPPAAAKAKPVIPEEKAKTAKAAAEKAAPPPVSVASNPSTGTPQYHIVKGGETLSKIAEQYYASVYQWSRIYEANRDTVKNPNYIYIGQKLIIPPESATGS
jgi:NitT/TauT family transport system substrate-binding protein